MLLFCSNLNPKNVVMTMASNSGQTSTWITNVSGSHTNSMHEKESSRGFDMDCFGM